MFRAYVMLALSLFVGIMFIVDLYVVAVYVNIKFGTLPMTKRSDKAEQEEDYYRRGLGADYGFGLDQAQGSSRSVYFKFYFYPYEGHVSLVIPIQELSEAQVPIRPVMNYITQRIYAEFRHQLRLESQQSNEYVGPPVRQGFIWVSHRVLHDMAKSKGEKVETKFKRSVDVHHGSDIIEEPNEWDMLTATLPVKLKTDH